MQDNFNPGDLVEYSVTYNKHDYDNPDEFVGVKKYLGLVLRGGQHNALVHLNGRAEAGWISDEYLEVVSNAGR